MDNFLRAVKVASRYRGTLAGLVLSALAVACLWGGNLGTVYPIVSVVLQQRSLREWVDDSLADAIKRRDASLGTVNDLLTQAGIEPHVVGADPKTTPKAKLDALRPSDRRRLSMARSQLRLEEKAIGRARMLRPFIYRFLPSKPFPTLVVVVGVLMFGTALKSAFVVVNVVLADRLSELVAFDIRKSLYRETIKMNLGHFGEQRTSKLLSHFTHDLDGITAGARTLFGRALLEPLKIIACLVGAAFVCWRLLLLSLIVTPITVYLINRLAKSVKRANRKAMDEMAGVYQHLSETFNGIATVKAFTMEWRERQKMHRRSKEYLNKTMKISFYNALTKPSTELMSIGVVCVAILFGGHLVLSQKTHVFGIRMSSQPLTFELLMAFFALLAGVSDPFRKLAEVYNQIQRGAAACDRVFPLIDQSNDLPVAAKPISHVPKLQALSFHQVYFSYQEDCQVLNRATLEIPAYRRVAIVGPNGCGKSTLVKLVPRFYDPDRGAVCWNDLPLDQFHLKSLRRRIGIVSQQSLLFDDSVYNNIRYGDPAATEKQVIEAAKKAHAHNFITSRLRDGYATIVGQAGQSLSGGQRQRIALARAMLRNPEVLILDEATSQVDIESEQLIHRSLQSFMEGRTTIMITHRLSTLTLADQVVVMDAGRIIDHGTHEQLLNRCPLYQRLNHAEFHTAA